MLQSLANQQRLSSSWIECSEGHETKLSTAS